MGSIRFSEGIVTDREDEAPEVQFKGNIVFVAIV